MKWPATSGAESLWRIDRGSSPRSTILDFFDSVRTHRRRHPKPPAAEHLPCTDPAVQHQRPPLPPSKKTTHAGQKLPAHTPQTSQRRRNGARNGDEIEGQKAVTWSPPPPRRPRLGTQLSPGQTADEKTKLHACRLRRKGPRRGEEQTEAPLFHSDSASSTTALPPRHLPLNLSTCQQRTGAPPSTSCRSSRRQRRELTTSPALNRGDLNASGFASLSCSKGRGKRNRLSVWLFSQHLFLSFPRARAHPYPSFPFYPRDQPGKNQKPTMSSGPEVVHSGGCHCRRVRWQVEAPASVVAWICNCSDCSMRGNTHFVVPKDKFALQAGAGDFLTTYTFGTHTAKHTFCKVCGITSFYIPRSNPDGVAVTAACVDAGTLAHVEYRKADGRNWEKWIEGSGISEFSKPTAAE